MKKKIGVITLYKNNANYGGLLQAYALVKVLNNLGFSAEQIAFDRTTSANPLNKTRIERFKANPFAFIFSYLKKKINRYIHNSINKYFLCEVATKLQQRKNAFNKFEEQIPHTEVVSNDDIVKLNECFDIFICGSDQIWNSEQLREAYLLTFVRSDKIKISYAASIGRDCISEEEIQYLAERIKDFNAISVREIEAKNMLMDKLEQTVECVLDPTMLLKKEEWDDIVDPYDIDGEYVLTYFLGADKSQRIAAKKFADKKNMKLVAFPHILGEYRRTDANFADVDLYDVTPAQFLYLIKKAKYIITDSFHACVFSIIFKKDFVVFERQVDNIQNKMNARIQNLLKLANIESRLISPDDLIEIPSVDYIENESLLNKINQSYSFLIKNLKL